DIDFTVSYVPSATIDGTIVKPLDSTSPVTLMISGAAQRMPLVMSLAPRLAIAPGADGRFRFVNVAPGRHTISVTMSRPVDPASGRTGFWLCWQRADIDVNGADVTGVSLILQPPIAVSGRVAFDALAGRPPADLSRMELQLSPPPSVATGSG